jgi:hypothetical protein
VSVLAANFAIKLVCRQAALNEQRDAQPLAPVHVSAQFQHLLASKFTVSQMGDDDAKRVCASAHTRATLTVALFQATEDEDKVQAVRMGMFGPVTRQSFEWHPHALLCRRMNVPEPYPGCVHTYIMLRAHSPCSDRTVLAFRMRRANDTKRT